MAGFDGFSLYPITPALTTYALDMDAMTRASVSQLLARMEGSSAPPALRIILGRPLRAKASNP